MSGRPPRKPLKRHLVAVATAVLVLLLLAQPELGALTPLVDALGVDLLLTLFSTQLLAFLSTAWRPCWAVLRPRALRGLRALDEATGSVLELRALRAGAAHLLENGGGHLGQYLWWQGYGALLVARRGER